MGICIYCGKSAGLFRSHHPMCEAAARSRRDGELQSQNAQSARAVGAIGDYVAGRLSRPALRERLKALAADGMNREQLESTLCDAWGRALDAFLEDGVLSAEEETRLLAAIDELGIDRRTLERSGHWTRAVRAGVLRDVTERGTTDRITPDSEGLVLQKGETVIVSFNGARYLEQRTRTERVGGASGVTLRVTRGVYLRQSAFRSHPVVIQETVDHGTGLLALASKNLYFAGQQKAVRIPWKKIVTLTPYSDGFGILRDAQTAKPQTFITGDGWFTYNLATAIAQHSMQR